MRKGTATQYILNHLKNNNTFSEANWSDLARHIGWEKNFAMVDLYVNKSIDLGRDTTTLLVGNLIKII